MRKPAQAPAADPYRKARFRELAREIVSKDRHDRRSGYAVDTAGSIARALERAFREGFEAGRGGSAPPATTPGENDPLEWGLIPPRPRDAFWTICLFSLGRGGPSRNDAKLIPATTERGTPGWLLTDSRRDDIRPIADRSIAPLIRLGLLERPAAGPGCLIVSARGEATWERFIERGGQYPEDLTRPDHIGRD